MREAQMPQGPYTPRVTVQGQRYVDEPVLVQPKPLVRAIARTLGRDIPPHMLGFNRIVLRWKKPAEVAA